ADERELLAALFRLAERSLRAVGETPRDRGGPDAPHGDDDEDRHIAPARARDAEGDEQAEREGHGHEDIEGATAPHPPDARWLPPRHLDPRTSVGTLGTSHVEEGRS